MSWKKHQIKSFRKLITLPEWAAYIGVSRYTIMSDLKKYKMLYEYDPRDIYSVFDFLRFLLYKRSRPKAS
jgi:hypothetical protein